PPAGARREPLSIEDVRMRVSSTVTHGPGIHPRVAAKLSVLPREFLDWTGTNVRRQTQPGYVLVPVTTVLGDLTSAQMRILGTLAEAFGDGTVRVTPEQNLLFRWVKREDVQALYSSIAAAGLERGGAGTLADVTSCPGAETCRLAVTQSRGLGR